MPAFFFCAAANKKFNNFYCYFFRFDTICERQLRIVDVALFYVPVLYSVNEKAVNRDIYIAFAYIL